MITQYSNFKYGTTQVSKIFQGETLVWPPDSSIIYYTPTPIDLGLSVKWASFNLGATRPEEYGYRYAWGETSPKVSYDWDNYIWCLGTSNTLTKYNTDSAKGTVDNKTQLELQDDAARVNLGGTWRIPTREEWQELIDDCTWTWLGGIDWSAGWQVTSNIIGYTSNSIFLPCPTDPGRPMGKTDYLWSSTLCSGQGYTTTAYALWYRYVYQENWPDPGGQYVAGKSIQYRSRAKGMYSDYLDPIGAGIRPVCT